MSLFKKASGDPNVVKDAMFYRQEAERHRTEYLASLKLMGRMIILAGASLAILAGTLAWYANNQRIDAGGMATNTQATTNLVIAKQPETLQSLSNASLQAGDTVFSVSFDNEHLTLIPARHNDSIGSTVNLEFNTNSKAVSPSSGIAANGAKPLTFGPVPEYDPESPDPRRYYYQYEVYMASTEAVMHAGNLNAAITVTPIEDKNDDGKIDENDIQDYMHALSVDFYVKETPTGTFRYEGTLNQAGKDWENSGADVVALDLSEADDGIDIPCTKDSYITVLLRCYFDGGLEREANQAYVYSDNLKTTGYTLNIQFTAENVPEGPVQP